MQESGGAYPPNSRTPLLPGPKMRRNKFEGGTYRIYIPDWSGLGLVFSSPRGLQEAYNFGIFYRFFDFRTFFFAVSLFVRCVLHLHDMRGVGFLSHTHCNKTQCKAFYMVQNIHTASSLITRAWQILDHGLVYNQA